jgi:succinate dehydrogenase / fumarate reductase membrane anchor subunit
MKSSLAKVNNLGSARSGTSHHIRQRVTAIFMIPLLVWFIVTLVSIISKPLGELHWFLTSPITLVGSVLFLINALYHGTLGMQMVIEDYVHCKKLKAASLITLYGITITTMVAAVLAIFTIYILLRIS